MKEKLVLVADDDPNIRQLYTDALSLANITTVSASGGEEAVKIALKEHPAVILMDIMMPDLSGHDAVKKIRMDSWGKTAKVIYLTNLTEPENVVKAFEQKPEEYIVKVHTDVREVVSKVRIAMS